MSRHSKNREAILECLKTTKSHPSAEWVYERLKPEYPNLSLGTVYRNLAQLKEAGILRTLGTIAGQERFDADLSCHHHIICSRCGAVLDLEQDSRMERMLREFSGATDADIREIRFVGLCPDCKRIIKILSEQKQGASDAGEAGLRSSFGKMASVLPQAPAGTGVTSGKRMEKITAP